MSVMSDSLTRITSQSLTSNKMNAKLIARSGNPEHRRAHYCSGTRPQSLNASHSPVKECVETFSRSDIQTDSALNEKEEQKKVCVTLRTVIYAFGERHGENANE